MKVNIPFISSRGFECGQACAAMMIKYYRSGFNPDFDEINGIIHHQKGKYSFPPQLALLLDHFGIQTTVYSSDDIFTSDEDPDQFKRWFKDDYVNQIKFIDIPTVDWMAAEMKKRKLFVKKETQFDELLAEFGKGNLVGMPIDWNTVTGKGGSYAGHFVVISGREGDDLLIHDPDIGPFRKHPASLIRKAWEHSAIADDWLLATGKKSGS